MLLALLLLASTASAADRPTYYPPKIQEFVNCTVEASLWVVPDARQAPLYEAARQCLDDKIAGALEDAATANDLRAALKAYYLKGQARFAPRSLQTAKAEFDEARSSVFLETKLAGLANEAALRKN